MPPRPLLKHFLDHLSPLPEMGIFLLFIIRKEDMFVMLVSHGLLCGIQTDLQAKASWPPVQIESNKY